MNYLALSFRNIGIGVITILFTADISYAHPNHPPVPVLEITTDLTWSQDIRPIFREKCMNCHSPTGILPGEFSMSTYAGTENTSGARDWVYGIVEEILTKRMPPWGADPRYNSFGNHRFLTQEEIETIAEWARGGRPHGFPKDLPTPPEFLNQDWSLGEPDMVFEMPEPHVLSVDVADSQISFSFPVSLDGEEEWITAIEFLPEDPTVVHTMTAFIHNPVSELEYTIDMEVLTKYDPMDDEKPLKEIHRKTFPAATHFVGQWVRGDTPVSLPKNAGRLLRDGSTIELKINYHRDSVDAISQQSQDKSKFGIHFANEDIQLVSDSLIIENKQFRIPADESDHEVRASATLGEAAYLYAAYPHMGLLAKDIELTAHYPDGRLVTLLLVPEFKYGLNQSYIFEKPIFAPAATRLEVVGHYDNSTNNWDNPYDPPQDIVVPGDERLLLYLDYYSIGRIYRTKVEP